MTNTAEKLLDWFHSGSTGASSKCMAYHLTGRDCDGSYPHDSGDFQRCVGLLSAVPELRLRLAEMAKVNQYWAALVPVWDKLECQALAIRDKNIRAIIRPLEDKDRNIVRLGGGASIRFGGKP